TRDASSFIQGFTGSDRFILDYLVEEVLQQQPAEVRGFLLETAILDRLCGPLCDALLDREDSQSMLERLEANNLFVVPLDHQRRWYRYHRLFADLLRVRLAAIGAERVASLHLLASRWYERQNMISDAFHHALAAGDLDLAGGLVERSAWQLFIQGEARTLQGWLKAVGEQQVRRRPWLSILYAWSLLVEGKVAGLEGRLLDAEAAMQPDILDAERSEMLGHMGALRAYVAVLKGDARGALEHARQADLQLPSGNLQVRSTLAYTRGLACLLLGDLRGAMDDFAMSSDQGRASGNIHLAVPALSALAGLLSVMGKLRQASDNYRLALELVAELAGPRSPLAARVLSATSVLEYEWNHLEEALRMANESVELGRLWGHSEVRIGGCIALARVLAARGDMSTADLALQEAERLVDECTLSPGIASAVVSQRVRWRLDNGEVDSAFRQIQESGIGATEESHYLNELDQIARARVLIAMAGEGGGNGPALLEEAIELLSRLEESARGGGRKGRLISIHLLQALAFHFGGEVDRAIPCLLAALRLAEPERYLRSFIDLGSPMEQLLKTALQLMREPSSGVSPTVSQESVHGILTAMRGETAGVSSEKPGPYALGESGSSASQRGGGRSSLAEPLSDREMEVLRLVVAGMSNIEIADQLVIAESTVKSHLNTIFGKLSVKRRTQAVARARELGLA
ncbi:MAG TPA: LuxR C-terminal-related transcriptional regulator, partial [Chloroflexota bacterium]|nr:LuxR C-terminal-related transcriptional regulator [Chloroflexota bacterium]